MATREDADVLCGGSATTRRLPPHQLGDHHQIVGEDRGADEQFEMLATLDERALHAAPAKQHRDAAFDARPESLSSLERPACLERFPFGAPLASRLRDAGERDAGALAGPKVLFVEEAAIRTIQIRSGREDAVVPVERRLDMHLVGGVSIEHPILGNQPMPAFGQEHLVTELHRCEDLAPDDQTVCGSKME